MYAYIMYDSLHLTNGAQIILSFSPTFQKIRRPLAKGERA